MSGIIFSLSSPEAVQQMRDLADAMIKLNGRLTEDLYRILRQKADEFGVHKLDMEDILKELSPVPSTLINEIDGTELVLIPEGRFLAGGPEDDQGNGGPFPVWLPAYYLALYPVTNIQYARFLSQSREGYLKEMILLDSDCFVRKAGSRYEAYGDKNDHPVVRVSWYGAIAYAKWAGLRLPSELEWEKGSRGVDGRQYPWGNTWDDSKCCNRSNRGRKKTCSIQSYPEGHSPWGLYQMSGNIWEWCEDWYDSKAYNRYRQGDLSPPSEKKLWGRVLRGGSWFNSYPKDFCGAFRYNNDPENRSNRCGFRLARTVTL